MREFSNDAVLSMSDSTMALSSKYTQDLSVQIVFFTFSFKWFLCVYFWAVIWDILLTCLLLCMSLRQLARAHYYKARIIGARALKTLWRHLKCFKPLFHWTILALRGNVILSNFSAKEKHCFWAILALKSTVLLSNFSAEKHCFTPGVLLSDFSSEKHCFAERF